MAENTSPDEDERKTPTVLRALRSTTGRESTTFGFSILVTVTFGLLQASAGAPNVPQIFLYAIGSVLSFTVLEGLLSKGFTRSMPQHPTITQALGTSMNLLSVLAGMGVALLLTTWLDGNWLWSVAPFAAAVAYLLMESIESALAERILVRAGHRDASHVEP